jgi:hypothetical protein
MPASCMELGPGPLPQMATHPNSRQAEQVAVFVQQSYRRAGRREHGDHGQVTDEAQRGDGGGQGGAARTGFGQPMRQAHSWLGFRLRRRSR